ncbi:hypothetical protein HDU85_001814 [Gaertneriomyces sp. JEL0708]|nr:hypothetical protein HDU85_001814 [Gaertneriomyces sp. JEL0708]
MHQTHFPPPSFGATTSASSDPEERVNKYETALGMRADIQAAMSYALGCITGVLLLVLETKNDYVRFHAWQSTILFLGLMVLQFLFSFMAKSIVWLILFIEIPLAAWLAWQAYHNGDSLERYELPIVGKIASTWVDSE